MLFAISFAIGSALAIIGLVAYALYITRMPRQ